MPQRRELPQLCRVAEGHDFQRRRNIDAGPLEKRAKSIAHLLEAHGDLASAILSGIGGHGEMRRMYLHPSRLIGE